MFQLNDHGEPRVTGLSAVLLISLQMLLTWPILQMREGRLEQVQLPAEGHRAVGGEFMLWSWFCDPLHRVAMSCLRDRSRHRRLF